MTDKEKIDLLEDQLYDAAGTLATVETIVNRWEIWADGKDEPAVCAMVDELSSALGL